MYICGMSDAASISSPPVSGAPSITSHKHLHSEHNIGYQMRRIVTLVGTEIERRMEPLGLTDAQWKPLLRMYLDEETTVAALARGCHLDAGAMTRLLDRLEAKGLCRRTRSLEDRRVVNLELTPEGRTAAEQIPGIVGRVQDVAAQGFSEEEFRQLRGFLTRLLDNVQVFGSPACHNDNEGSST